MTDSCARRGRYTQPWAVINASVVTPTDVMDGATVQVEAGRIVEVGAVKPERDCQIIDAGGALLLPGIIDLHSDIIESAIEPRPRSFFPYDMAILNLDRHLMTCGVTTMFYSLAFFDIDNGLRHPETALSVIRELENLAPLLSARVKIHLRYEVTETAALPALEKLMQEKRIDLVSLMNHTPGQGQFKEHEGLMSFYRGRYGATAGEAERLVQEKAESASGIEQVVARILSLAREHGIPAASHDDDSEAKVEMLHAMGVAISEFPVNLEAAAAAQHRNMPVLLGAPNVIRGKSHSNNLSATDALAQGIGTVLCSDYAPMALLQAVFVLSKQGIKPLPEAMNMVSRNAAKAVGMNDRTGSIEAGKQADMMLVDFHNGTPIPRSVWVGGRNTYRGPDFS
jgi:alpha-D-ribose 1-methylphosphonate 5-triphosphate diphosphatase